MRTHAARESSPCRASGTRTSSTIAAALCLALILPLSAQKQLEMRVPAHILTAPAELQVSLYVEPHRDNRALVVEADGDNMFTSSQLPLEGGTEKRFHLVRFRSLLPGEYVIRATLHSGDGVRATISTRLVVADF
jgi:hypothetical protein